MTASQAAASASKGRPRGKLKQIDGKVLRGAKAWLREAGTGVVFRPTPKQRRIWEIVGAAPGYSRVLIGYGGAVGGGKTRALAEFAIDALLEFPGNVVLLGRRDMVDLRDTTMQEFKAAIPREVVTRENQRFEYMELRKKDWPRDVVSRIYFRGLKDLGSLGSTAYGAVLIDEAHEVSTDVAQYLFGRLRWRLPPVIQQQGYVQKYVFLAASNPFPGWFQRWFVDRDLPEALLADASVQVHFVPARIADNPHVDPGYEASLRAMFPESWVRRLVEGTWDVIEGAVYPEFAPSIHRWPQGTPIPKFTALFGGLDFGGSGQSAHATAGLIAGLTQDNRLIRLDEYYQRGGDRPIERLVRWMGDMEDKWRPYLLPAHADSRPTWTADGSQVSFIELLRKAFIIRPSQRNRGSVRYGIALVSQRLSTKPPGSFYLPHLSNFEEEMLRYHWPHSEHSIPNTPVEIDDDLLDCDRYIHMTLESRRPNLSPSHLPSLSDPSSPTTTTLSSSAPLSSPHNAFSFPSIHHSSSFISYQPDF